MLNEIFTTNGRLNRLLYAKYFLILFIASVIVNGLVVAVTDEGFFRYILSSVLSLPFAVGNFMIGIRRLHDLDKNGWLIILAIVPFINVIFELYLFLFKGTDGANQYGADPLGF